MDENKVVKARVEDYNLLAMLGRQAFDESFGSFNDPDDMKGYLDVAFNPETIAKQLIDEDITFFIAYNNNIAAGYAKVKRNATFPVLEGKRVIQLERIYRLKAFSEKKIGCALMQNVIKISKAENFESIWLSVWQENKIAIDFYKKWNFEVIGYKQFKIGNTLNDDFVMALEII